jgi:D-lyxose ketol-isomerase
MQTGVTQMIEHTKHIYPSGYVSFTDAAQYEAEECNRQEVTAEWYLTVGLDHDMQLWAYLDGQSECGLDLWRMIDGPEDAPRARYFVQRNHLARAA